MGHQFLLGIAAFVIIVAGLKAAASLVVPFLLAIFLSILCAPPLTWLKNHKVSSGVAILIILAAVVLMVLLLASMINTSVSGFNELLPLYQEKLQLRLENLHHWLTNHGLSLPQGFVVDTFNPEVIMGMAKSTLASFGGILSNVLLILLTMLFILMEVSTFPQKLKEIAQSPDTARQQASLIIESINRYMGIKSLTSMATGFLVWLLLTVLGVDFPILWGLLAFLFNFVPTVGSIIAAIPAVLLALIQAGIVDAALVASGYLVINVLIGNLLEPPFMGRNLGLSTLVVFLSLVFWGWVLGPIGMILSVPLTMGLKIALENNPNSRSIAILLGSVKNLPS